MTNLQCPLCSTDFEAESCHGSCPMSRHCAMSRCPRCGYEFVTNGGVASLLRKLFQRRQVRSRGDLGAARDVRVIDLPVGASASIAFIESKTLTRLEKLAAFGIVPGSEIRLVARKPSCVIATGATSIALEDDIGREIYVRIGHTRG